MGEQTLPRYPLLTTWHRLVQEEDRVVLEYGGEAVCLEGRATRTLLPALLPLLDGTRTVDEITTAFGGSAGPAVRQALELLAAHDLLAEGPSLDPGEPQPFASTALFHLAADRLRTSPAAVRAALGASHVGVVGESAAAVEIVRLLRLSGIGEISRDRWDDVNSAAGLVIAAPDPSEVPLLSSWNERALAAGTDWLQVLPYDGAVSAIGPLFVPGETCCHACYRHRRAANVDYGDEFWALERSTSGIPDAPALAATVAGIASIVALRWLLFRDPWAAGVVATFELGESLRLATHVVYRLPRCSACGTANRLAAPLPWAEASRWADAS